MEEILPPTPPGQTNIIANKKEDSTIQAIEPKTGFLTKLFTKKEQPINAKIDPFNTPEPKFEVPDPDMSSDDLSSIRQALGLKEEEKYTFAKEQKIVEEPEKKIEEIQEIPPIEEKPQEITPKEKHKSKKKKIEEKPKEEFPEDSIELPPPPEDDIPVIAENIVSNIAPEKKKKQKKHIDQEFSELDEQLKKTKEEIVKKAKEEKLKKGKPLQLTSKEEKIFELKIKRIIRKYEIIAKRKLYAEKANLNKKTINLVKEIKTLEIRDLQLKKIEARHNEREEKIMNEQKRLSQLSKDLRQERQELDELSISLTDEKAQYEKLKDENAHLNILISEKKEKLTNHEKEYKAELKELTGLKIKAEKEYRAIQSKSQSILNILKSKEEALKSKEKDVRKMLDEEKRIFDYLQGGSPPDTEEIKKQILTEPRDEPKTMPNLDMKQLLQPQEEGNPIQAKIDDCKDLIHEQNLEDAKFLYNEIRKDFLEVELEEEEKEKFKHEIRELYDEIALGMLRGR